MKDDVQNVLHAYRDMHQGMNSRLSTLQKHDSYKSTFSMNRYNYVTSLITENQQISLFSWLHSNKFKDV